MAEFYKQLFQPYQKQWVEQKKKSAMANLMQSFAIKNFEHILLQLHPQTQQEFVSMLTVVVHSHRHNKDDDFISDNSLDFTLVRDTMYKYSKKAQERFFSYPIFAFLFAWFAQSPQGLQFTYQKFHAKGQEYFLRMKEEIDDLKREALGFLRKATMSGKDEGRWNVLLEQFNL